MVIIIRYLNHFTMISTISQYAFLHLIALLSRLLSSKLGSWLSPNRWGAPNPDDDNKDDDHTDAKHKRQLDVIFSIQIGDDDGDVSDLPRFC